jgi:ribosome-associated protein
MMGRPEDPEEEEPAQVTEEQDRTVVGSGMEAPPPPTNIGDPRRSARPGLPSSRRERNSDPADLEVSPSEVDPEVLRLAHRIVDLAADKKASDIVLLDVRGQTTMTDYFVICSGASDRQIDAIADGIISGLRDEGERPLSREGEASSHWILVDFGGIIVHVMSVPEREFYQLEKLWARAALLLHIV